LGCQRTGGAGAAEPNLAGFGEDWQSVPLPKIAADQPAGQFRQKAGGKTLAILASLLKSDNSKCGKNIREKTKATQLFSRTVVAPLQHDLPRRFRSAPSRTANSASAFCGFASCQLRARD
jgi:hypothetical protein